MAPSVYTISFVLEKIHRTYVQSFILSIRFEGHDWCNVGQFDDSDLPVGFIFTTILSSFNNADKFNIEVNLSNSTSFLACLQFSKRIGEDILLSRGLSILYSKDREDSVMAITIAVKVAKYYHSPTTERSWPLKEREVQTDHPETRAVQIQVQPCCKTTGSNTELHLLSTSELEDTVANIVAEHLTNKKVMKTKENLEEDVGIAPVSSSPQPIPISHKSTDLGKNIVPRLQKLRVLDKMIDERTSLVEQFDASLVKIELARKREFILKSRDTSVNMTRTETVDVGKVLGILTKFKPIQKRETHDAATQSEKLDSPMESVQSSSSRSSASNSSTSDTSEQDEIDEEGMEVSESASETSSSSTSSSKETILRRNSLASPNLQRNGGQIKSSADVSMRQQPERTNERSLSPTSLYLKQLREKILQERMQKI